MRYKLTKKLVQKSTEAFLLSLELYNKPTISYRAESFSLLFSNAWELLLKAYIFEQNSGRRLSIFRKKQRNKKRESIGLDEAISKIFLNQNDPVRRNIEYISEIRNEATHLVIQELYPYFSRAFQAGISNYISYLNSWFKIDINQKLNPGLVSLITDKDSLIDLNILKRKYNKEDLETITRWVNKFNELEKLGESATISIQYKLAIVKNPRKADIVLSSGATSRTKGLIIEKLKDPDSTHPYNRKKAISLILSGISSGLKFNQHDFEAYCFVQGIKRENDEYFYKGQYSGAGQFSKKFINEIVEAISTKSLKQWRRQYKQHIAKKR